MGSHSVTCHPTQVNTPRLNPSQTGWCSIYLPEGMEGWVDLGRQSPIQIVTGPSVEQLTSVVDRDHHVTITPRNQPLDWPAPPVTQPFIVMSVNNVLMTLFSHFALLWIIHADKLPNYGAINVSVGRSVTIKRRRNRINAARNGKSSDRSTISTT